MFDMRVAKTAILVSGLLTSAVCLAQQPLIRRAESNPNYQQGDWISYSVARYISSIAVGREYVYFGTQHSGITRFHQFNYSWDFPWTVSNGLADNSVSVVAYDSDTDFIWCATRYAISYYHSTARKWRNYFKDEFGLPFQDDIESIGVSPGRIYFESRGGRRYEIDKFGGIVVNSNDGFAGSNGRVTWFGRKAQQRKQLPSFFMSQGYLFNPGGVIEDPHFRRAEIVSAVEDGWGNMWIGTWGLGAGKADVRSLRLDMLDFGLAKTSADALALSEGVLWVGGVAVSDLLLGSGITAWDMQRDRWQIFEQKYISELRSDQVNEITADDDRVWFSTEYGLSSYSNRNATWQTFDRFDGLSDNIVFDVVADDSSIWIGTDSGLSRLDRSSLAIEDSVKVESVSPGNLSIVEIRDLELMGNLLWAATDEGIYVYDTRKHQGGFSDEIEGPFSTSITSISRYGNEVWFGSTAGIDVFDVEKREWAGVPKGRVFPNTRINKVLATEKAVWAATDDGVKKYDRKSKSWRTYTIEDGLIDNRVYTMVMDGDYIWFGTESGITKFYWNDPRRID